jgi:hypothetical protein
MEGQNRQERDFGRQGKVQEFVFLKTGAADIRRRRKGDGAYHADKQKEAY